MLSSRMSLILALGLSLNTTIAQERPENTVKIYSQEKQPLLVASRIDSRRRGECGQSPNLWAINLCDGNTFCYADPNDVSFWLPERPKRAVIVSVENSSTGESFELSWETAKPTLAWPTTQVPLISENAYWIDLKQRRQGSVLYKEMVLYQIPADRRTLAEKAAWMKEKGCESQYQMLTNGQAPT